MGIPYHTLTAEQQAEVRRQTRPRDRVPRQRTPLKAVRFSVDLPPKPLWQNRRYHWAAVMRAKRAHRDGAFWAAAEASKWARPRWQRATMLMTFYWPDRRKRDIWNAQAAMKSAVDGIVDAGLIVDDESGVLGHEPSVFDVDRDNPRVEVRLWRADR